MAQKKKLQVFISSTYSDLLEERQAAVEVILKAGHIPAGMELFAAGDQSQMNVIKRWIDESDVYMLILGGRYGSIEPTTLKSYIQLEYEYAIEKNKPLFAVVITEDHLEEKVKQHGSKVIETDHPDKLKSFRTFVLTKLVGFWSDTKDIKLAIHETLSEFSDRPDLTGWIPGNEAINSGAVAEEIARLAKENADLREKISNSPSAPTKYNGLTYDEMRQLLSHYKVDIEDIKIREDRYNRFNSTDILLELASKLEETTPNLLQYLWLFSRYYHKREISFVFNTKADMKLYELGIIDRGDANAYFIAESGQQFLLRLRLEKEFSETEELIL